MEGLRSCGLGEARTQSNLETLLEQLGYWPETGSLLPGEYEWRQQSLAVYTRPTWTRDGLRSPTPLLLRLENDRIVQLEQGGKATDHILLGRPLLNSFYGPDRLERRPVNVGELPENVIYAILAAEDASFSSTAASPSRALPGQLGPMSAAAVSSKEAAP